MDMDTQAESGLVKKTTILFAPDMYERLSKLAAQRHSSVGELVREACRAQYFRSNRAELLSLVDELESLSLPVGTPEQMKRESIPAPEPLP